MFLAPAAHHDVVVAPELLESCPKKVLTMGDKGYVGVEKRLENPENHDLIIQRRQNRSGEPSDTKFQDRKGFSRHISQNHRNGKFATD